MSIRFAALLATFIAWTACAAENLLPGTRPLEADGDRAVPMVAGIGRFLDRELAASIGQREQYWKPDFASREAYEKSVRPNRERLARILGAIDDRKPEPELEYLATIAVPAKAAETELFTAYAVRWPVLEGVFGEGLLLQPKRAVIARVIALPDADQTPEAITGLVPGVPVSQQFARRLAENGCQVIVPFLTDRADTFSGNAGIGRETNQPHREWIYRQAYVLGRHIIGYEVLKLRSALDWFERQNRGARLPVGVAGWGEGGLLAFYGAAVDTRIDAAFVSGYFGPREQLWREPMYRNVSGLLREFGDAGVARLIVPRTLIVEHAAAPAISGPPTPREGHAGAAPGRIETPSFPDVSEEVKRAQRLAGPFARAIRFRHGRDGGTVGPLADESLLTFLQGLDGRVDRLMPPGGQPGELRPSVDLEGRQERTVRDMQRFTQRQLQLASGVREQFLWKKVSPTTPEAWREAMRPYREKYWNENIGRFPTGDRPLNPRSRLFVDHPGWTGYEVTLDVLPDVFAWGYFLVPKGIRPGEKRPVVVAQHGLEGAPQSVIEEDPGQRANRVYKAFAVRLVERGFIVFAPQNPYRGDDNFRVLQRKANPLGKTLFGIIVAQHERILDWLAMQPNVDAGRIGFYGISYGGNASMVLPAILERYALTIDSGCFNDWIFKNVSTDWRNTYVFSREYEKPDFNLGQTFGDAEIAALIAPRPFMVERGHDDAVGLDEWVAYEYAKVNRLYAKLKIPQRTEIEYFEGVHEIHGVGSFRFLHRHLGWPEPGMVKGISGGAR